MCPLWERFLDTPLDEVLAMLTLRPEWAKDDGHYQFRAIGGTVFGDTSLEASIEIRKNLVAWVTDNYNVSVQSQLRDKSTKQELLRRLQKYEYDANDTLMVLAPITMAMTTL